MKVRIKDLRFSELSKNIYSHEPPEDLVRSIGENGLLVPIWISEDNIIISGHRRANACQVLGLEEIEAEVREYSDTLVIEANRYREKTWVEKLKEAEMLKRLLVNNGNAVEILCTFGGNKPGQNISLYNNYPLCHICNTPFIDKHHTVPKSLDGEEDVGNLAYLCPNHHKQLHYLIGHSCGRKDYKNITEKKGMEILFKLHYIEKFEPKLYQYFWEVVDPAIKKQREIVIKIVKAVREGKL